MIFDGIYEKLEKMEKGFAAELLLINKALMELTHKITDFSQKKAKNLQDCDEVSKSICKRQCTAKQKKKNI